MKRNTITAGGNIPLPGQQRPSTIILFGLDIVNYCLIQSDLNRFAD